MKTRQIRLVQHPSAPDIVKAHNDSLFARIKEVEGIDLSGEAVEWGDENESLSDEEIINHIEDAGFWGWCDTQTRTIHFWFSRTVSDEMKVKLIAHEVAHLSGKPCKDPEKEENRCDKFADIVDIVFMLFKQIKKPEYLSINTVNAICGLITKRQAVKELISPHGDIANQEMAKELIREFCVENQWAFSSDVPIPADSTYFIDWDAVTTVARTIARNRPQTGMGFEEAA